MLAKITLCAVVASSLWAGSAFASFLPPNHLDREDDINARAATGLTQAQWTAVIDQAEAYYKPLIKTTYKANFSVSRLWTNPTVNANATQSGTSWVVNMYGGLARRPEVTPDGFALVLCHEIGHQLGGYPFVSAWAANEGQADYFAGQSCARDLWKTETAKNALARNTVEDYPKAQCDATWKTVADQNLCYRIMNGGKSLANLLSTLEGSESNWDTPDETVVRVTDNDHPAGQCRLDTYVAAALCAQPGNAKVIPAKDLGSKRNTRTGEQASEKYTCLRIDYKVGNRPLCWFKPLL